MRQRKSSFHRALRASLAIVVTLLLSAFCFGQMQAATSGAWNEFHRPNNERFNPNESILNISNVKNLKLKWSYTTAGFVDPSPMVVNGIAYFGSEDDYVYALQTSTGGLLWRYRTGGFVHGAPAVANGMVYAGSEDGYLYALKATTGAKIWNYHTGVVEWSSPAVANGVVYVGSNEDFNIYALSAGTGALLWS